MTRPTRCFIVPALIFLGILVAGCADDQDAARHDTEGARSDIEGVNERFETYVAQQQWDSLMTLYTEDAIMMAPGAPSTEGGAIRQGFAQMGQMGVTGIDLETVDVEVAANTAYEVGTYSVKGPNDMEVDQGKYLVVWKNVDGEWKLHRDMYNTNQPTSGGGMPSDGMPADTAMADTASVDTSMAR